MLRNRSRNGLEDVVGGKGHEVRIELNGGAGVVEDDCL